MRQALCTLIVLATATPAAWAAGARPRIFITPDDLPRLRAMASDTKANSLGFVPADAWKSLKAKADRFVAAKPYSYSVTLPGRNGGAGKKWSYTLSTSPPPRHDAYRHYPSWTAMFQERSDSITTRLKHLLLAHVVTGDAKYFERAKRIVMNLCAWPGVWTDPSYSSGRPCLDTGHAATWVGVFYDWCHAKLTPAERATVRKALTDKAVEPIHKMIRTISPYHNFTAVIATGLAIGAIALDGEDPRSRRWIQTAVARAKLNFSAQGSDGGAMEGPMYGTYAAQNFADMIWALDTAGVRNNLVDHRYIRTLPGYCVSLLDPGTWQQPCFGDGGPGAGFGRTMLVLALRGDTQAAWYCQQTNQLDPSTVRRFVALDRARIKPARPTGNPSGAFVDIGYAILRDGYKPTSAFMALKCGPPTKVVGHNHFDHNSFVISYAGAWVASDPGYRSYFNPPERRYTTSTLGHSSVVLDMDAAYLKSTADKVPGHDQVSLTGGRIREFFAGEAYDYVLGDAAKAYNAKSCVLKQFDRQIVFAKPNVFFVRDTLAASKAHAYSLLLHTFGEIEIADGRAQLTAPRSLLQAHVYSPAGVRLTSAMHPGAESRGPYLAATTGKTRNATFTSVLVPRHNPVLLSNGGFEKGKSGWRPRNVPGFAENHVIDTQVKHGGKASARIDNGGYYYSTSFNAKPGTRLTARWWAKCTSAKGAGSLFYFWKGGKSFANAKGPVAKTNQWKQYELTAVVPKGTDQVCLSLQFFGKGQCWYDDVEITTDQPVPASKPAKVTPLEDGAAGAVCEVDGVTHVLVCGKRTVRVGAHEIASTAELAVVTLLPDEPRAFTLRGTVSVDGTQLDPAAGQWRVKRR